MARAATPDYPPVTVSAIAAHLGLEVAGPETKVTGVDSLDAAGSTDLAFSVYEDAAPVEASDAGAVICPHEIGEIEGTTLLKAPNPKLAFARAVTVFFEPQGDDEGIHETAVVEPGAEIGTGVRIGPHAYVADCVTIGDDCTIRAGAILGREGFGFVRDDGGTPHRLPHRGGVTIGDHVEIGANTTIDRAVFGETVIDDHAKLSGNVHLAHGVEVGPGTLVSYHCGIAGSAVIGENVMVHPHVTVANDVVIGDGAVLGMNAAVLDEVPEATTVVGSPARPIE